MGIQLGEDAPYPNAYDASLLEPIPRSLSRGRESSGLYYGCDYWTAFELSWLNESGLPQIAWGEFRIPASSPNIIESKSFKYYLNSFNESAFTDSETVSALMRQDLSAVAGGGVAVTLHALDNREFSVASVPGHCLDAIDCHIETYAPDADLLVLGDESVEDAQLYSNLFKSNCPVTGQPDWATLWIAYSGQKIAEESLLKYLVSYRNHQGFHEACVEQIFLDISTKCQPTELCVYARYTRRGGLDINPFRVSHGWRDRTLPFTRLLRQ